METRIRGWVTDRFPLSEEDESLFLKDEVAWGKDVVDHIRVIRCKFMDEDRSLFVGLNHGVIGGGDYLELGSCMFGGKKIRLYPEEHSAWRSVLLRGRFYLDVWWNILLRKQNVGLHQLPLFPKSVVRREAVQMEEISAIHGSPHMKIQTRVYVIHHIMSTIVSSLKLGRRGPLLTWLPVGSKKNGNLHSTTLGSSFSSTSQE